MAIDLQLKYGCNPNQPHARVAFDGPGEPLKLRNGRPSFINLLDALRSWQLVRDLKAAVNKPAAASFKHVSPAGAAVAGELSPEFRKAHFYPSTDELDLSPIATAYARARASDRVASFGDFIAVSEPVDASLALLIKPEVSDGIIAPGYDDDALKILSQKKAGGYVMLEIDPAHTPPPTETRTLFGFTLEESYNDQPIDKRLLDNIVTEKKDIPAEAAEALLVASAALKHTQSNSVALGWSGAAIGIGAGQQSRIACTRLACDKAERYFLKLHPKALGLKYKSGLGRPEKVNLADQFVRYEELDDTERRAVRDALEHDPEPITPQEKAGWLDQFRNVALSSDAFFPFRDNLDRAARSGVKYVVQAGGSRRDDDVIAAANEHGMTMAFSGVRLFLH